MDGLEDFRQCEEEPLVEIRGAREQVVFDAFRFAGEENTCRQLEVLVLAVEDVLVVGTAKIACVPHEVRRIAKARLLEWFQDLSCLIRESVGQEVHCHEERQADRNCICR